VTKTKKRHYCKLGLPLRTILRKWISLNERIAQDWRYKDVPWWYNERAALSIFSGGIWNSGEFAFEEFSDEKRKISARSRRDSIELTKEGLISISTSAARNSSRSRRCVGHVALASMVTA
jgi:hypothetical protein